MGGVLNAQVVASSSHRGNCSAELACASRMGLAGRAHPTRPSSAEFYCSPQRNGHSALDFSLHCATGHDGDLFSSALAIIVGIGLTILTQIAIGIALGATSKDI